MRVCYVISGLSMGGAEMMLLKLLEHGPQLRGRVVSLKGRGELAERFLGLGVKVDSLGMRAAFPDPLAFWRLVGILREEKPELVSTWMYHADLVGGLAARSMGFPTVWGIRNSTLDPTTKLATRAVRYMAARLSHRVPSLIISCSETARALHESIGYSHSLFRVIPNGFDLTRFSPSHLARSAVRDELGLGADALLVGLIARHDPQKDHLGFFQAARRVRAVRSDVHFLLAGTGISLSNIALRRAVEAAGLMGSVSLLGSRHDVPRLMAALDVLVSSSVYGEAFPNVLGEAMSCGVPCVVTDVGDSAAIVGDTGIAVSPGDPLGLAEGILRLIELTEEDRQELGRRARRRIDQNYSIQSVVPLYEAVFAEAIAKSKSIGRVYESEKQT